MWLRAKNKKLRAFLNIEHWHPVSSILLCAIILAGCEAEPPFESEDSVPTEISSSLTALNFPSADGSSWEYVSADGEFSHTVTIAGTRNLGGVAIRVMESDSEVPVDHLASLFGFPVRTSLFTKELDSYTEHAF